MAQRTHFTAMRDLITAQIAYALQGGKCDPAEILMMLADVLSDLAGEHEIRWSADELAILTRRLALLAPEPRP